MRSARRWLARRLAALLVVLAAIGGEGAALAQDSPVTISFALRPQGGGGAPNAGELYVQAVLAEFAKLHPEIHVEYVPLTGNWQDRMTAQMATGTAPDVFEMWGYFANNWGDQGMLLDLNPYVERDFSADVIADFYPGQWEAAVQVGGPYAGARIGIPRYVNTEILFYHQDAFDRAGLPYPPVMEAANDWNWTTFLEAAKKLTVGDGEGNVRTIGFRTPYWEQWVYSAGGRVFGWPEAPLEFLLDQPEAVAGLEFLRSLIWEHRVAEVGSDFSQGTAAMGTEWGSCCIQRVMAAVQDQFRWNIGPLPVGPTGKRHAWIGKDMWGIYAGTKHPEEAWTLVKFLVSPEASAIQARIIGEQPVRISALPAYQEALAGIDVHWAIEMGITAYPSATYVIPESQRIRDHLEAAVDASVRRNEKAVIQAIEEIKGPINALLDPYRH